MTRLAVLSDLNSALALFKTLEAFEKVSGLKLNVRKTEAMWVGSLQNCEDEPLGVKWQKCVKCLGIFIKYDVKKLVEKNFKQRLKKIKKLINLWRSRGLSIHGKQTGNPAAKNDLSQLYFMHSARFNIKC